MSNTEKSLVPHRRFKEFENAGAWERYKLGEHVELITKGTTPRDKSGQGEINFVKVENLSNGEITSFSHISRAEHEGYLKRSQLKVHDILFSIAGTLGRIAIVSPTLLPANTNQALAIIRGYDFDSSFLIATLAGHFVKDYISKNPTVGAQPNLSLKQVFELEINAPGLEEQRKVGLFFSSINKNIALHQRKLNKLKRLKSAYLTEMFPAEGERKPKRRFAGFTDDWEQRKVSDVAERLDNLRIPVAASKRKKGAIPYYGANGIQDYVVGFTHNGENVLIAEDGANDLDNYPVRFVKGKIWVNNHAHVLKSHENSMDNRFLVFALKKANIPKYLVGGSRAKLNADILMNICIKVPCLEEQKLIGSLFESIGHLITLHQRKLDKLKKLKSAYLNEMFV